jgi:hypothetical protein
VSKPVYAQQDNTTFNLMPVAVVAAATCKLSSTLDPVGVQGACRDGPTQRYDNRSKVPHVHACDWFWKKGGGVQEFASTCVCR